MRCLYGDPLDRTSKLFAPHDGKPMKKGLFEVLFLEILKNKLTTETSLSSGSLALLTLYTFATIASNKSLNIVV